MRQAACLGLLTLAGCGWMGSDGRDDYLTEEENPNLVVPEDMPATQIGDPYPIPPTPEQSNPEYFPFKPPLPDAIYGDDSSETVRIQRLDQRQWLVVPEPPSTLWPKVKQFFAENGVAVAAENPSAGRLDTGWMLLESVGYLDIVRTLLSEERGDDVPEQTAERIILRVEQGIKDRTAEVHLRHQRTAPDRVEFFGPAPVELAPVLSDNPAAEQKLLAELGAYVAAKVSEQSFSMVGQSITTLPKAVLRRLDSGEPALRLNLDEQRAWATIGQALRNAEIEVEDSDAQALEYRIAVSEENFTGDKPGWLSRLFSVGDRRRHVRLRLLPVSGATAFHALVDAAEGEDPIDRELAQAVLVLVREYAG